MPICRSQLLVAAEVEGLLFVFCSRTSYKMRATTCSWDMGVFHDGIYRHGEPLPAFCALIEASPYLFLWVWRDLVDAGRVAVSAVRAHRAMGQRRRSKYSRTLSSVEKRRATRSGSIRRRASRS